MLRIRTALLIFLCLVPLTHAAASVVISELLWSGSDLSSADEWIELTNTGTGGAVSLSGWTLTRLSGGKEIVMLTLPEGAMIEPGGTFLISNYNAVSSRLAITPNLVTTNVSLANTQLLIRLYDEHGVFLDAADDGVGAPFAGLSGTPKASMERLDLAGSGQLKTNWQTAATARNFDDGAAMFGTPGAPNGTGPTSDTKAPEEALMFTAEITATEMRVTWVPSVSLDLASQMLTYDRTLNNSTTLRQGSGGLAGTTLPASATGVTFASTETGVTFQLRSRDTNGNTSSGVTTISRLFPQVKITEVLANPMGNDDEEWIEIGNLGNEAVNIGGWILDEGNSPGTFLIPPLTTIAPHTFLVFSKSVTGLPLDNKGERVSLMRGLTLMDAWEYPETAEEVSYGRRSDDMNVFQSFCAPTPVKPNDVVLPDPRIIVQGNPDAEMTSVSGEGKLTLNLMATVMTGSTAHATCSWNYGDGYTSESCNPPSHSIQTLGTYRIRLVYGDFCGNHAERFLEAIVTPGSGRSTGTTGGDTGKEKKEPCIPKGAEGVRISELLPDPDGDDADGEWIEIENVSNEDVSLCGWRIDDGIDGSSAFALDAYSIASKQFLVLPRPVTNIALNNTNDAVRLFSPDGDMIDHVTYEKSHSKKSYARTKDGAFAWTEILTPGLTNRFPGEKTTSLASDVSEKNSENTLSGTTLIAASTMSTWKGGVSLFSEILPNPPKEGALAVFGEYLELVNPLADAISLAGWILDDAIDASSKPKTLSEAYVIPPGGYLLLCKGEGCDLPLGISLNNEGEKISLTSPDGTEQMAVTYPKLKQGMSYARHTRHNDTWCITKIATPKKPNICRSSALVTKKKSEKKSTASTKTLASNSLQISGNRQTGKPENPLSLLQTRYRHIYAESDAPRPTPEPPSILTSILSKTHQPLSAQPLSPFERSMLHWSTICGLLVVSAVVAGVMKPRNVNQDLVAQ